MTRRHFRWASPDEIQNLRQLVQAVRRWEKSAISGNYYLPPWSIDVLGDKGGMYWMPVMQRIKDRAWVRLRSNPQWDEIVAAHNLETMRQNNPEAYQSLKLRKDLDELRRNLELKGVLP